MTTWFISRHPGAIDWGNRQNLLIDRFEPHLDLVLIQGGDIVIGSLPVDLAAQVCARDAAYWHLSLALPFELRGVELNADDLERLGAKIEPFEIKPALTATNR
ncbi:CRISPR-associated protein Csx16 [Rhodoferax antarcticus]|uniref:CRISPR-associated family protein n=1 Tax=Rhodoferax antarcticus ANT.BR TaxID=1111071 RepID=A0A1Q8YF64_9BURK|nr:CRISPR-associated protein Csx16 [Rhodoferax antarcticus]APW46307.1 putative CRISPR-associated protein [Rhodoferax antarcticus]OLP06520.1 CRISPR-associated family protein [Rhodoferax antarcticus ANT.BR]